MRVLVVSHRYPPAHTAGIEVQCAREAEGPAARPWPPQGRERTCEHALDDVEAVHAEVGGGSPR